MFIAWSTSFAPAIQMDLRRRNLFPVSLFLKYLLSLTILVGISDGFVNYDGWKVLVVKLEKSNDNEIPPSLIKLEEMAAEGYMVILTSSKIQRIAEVVVSPQAFEDLKKLQENGEITFDVVTQNFGRKLKLERRGKRVLSRSSVTFKDYMNFDEISSYVQSLQNKYPSKVRVEEAGRSVEDRPIYLVRITNNIGDTTNRNVIFLEGGLHAREWISPASALFVIKKLISNKKLTNNIEWQIMPMVNPDGYVHSWEQDRLWRKNRTPGNCYGVDLNRNFGYQWGGQGTSSNTCSDIYKGQSAFSEPETKAIRDAMLPLAGKIKGYVTFHAYGQYILYPWGYATNVNHPDTSLMKSMGKKMAKVIKKKAKATYNVGNSATAFYPAAGASDDWVSHELDVRYSYTVELRDTGRHGFVLPADQIASAVKDAWAAASLLGAQIRKRYKKN